MLLDVIRTDTEEVTQELPESEL